MFCEGPRGLLEIISDRLGKYRLVSLEELQRSTAQLGEQVNRTAISCASHVEDKNMWKKVLLNNETKIRFAGLLAKCHIKLIVIDNPGSFRFMVSFCFQQHVSSEWK
ncbi:hypothetical protein AMECASPLE_018191 [Ameca splendens]|uniref:Uncharacterized protein n=1 Tax=Ameca splendens TaxID=208324 RepID=A0ABV0Z0N2_9TELE